MRGKPVTYLDYSGGRNTQNAPYLLTEKQCRDDLNVHTSLSGDIEKRPGFVTFSGATLTGAPVNGLEVHSLFASNTSTKNLVGVASTGGKDMIFKLTTGGIASLLKISVAANARWYFAQAEVNGASGPVFGMNGVDVPQRWSGSAATTSDWVATTGTVPKTGKYLTYFASRLWCAVGSRLSYSGLTGSSPDPLAWDANDYVDLDPNDGQVITGIGSIGSYLVVFKSRKTYIVYDTITGANRQVSNQIGCVAHRSIVQTPAGLFFLSEDQGVCRTNGETITPFSEQVKPDLDQVARVSPATQALAAGVLEGRRYYLSISKGGVRNDHTLEYDLDNQSWWLHDCAVNQFALLDPSGDPTLYSADSTASARVSEAFVDGTYTDNNTEYTAFWTSPWRAWGVGSGGLNPHIVKRINEIRVDGVGTWDAYVAQDFSTDFELMEGETWSATGGISESTSTFEEERAGTFEEVRAGTFLAEEEEAGIESTVSVHYPTPSLGRSHSMKYENEDAYNFRIYSETIALTARTN